MRSDPPDKMRCQAFCPRRAECVHSNPPRRHSTRRQEGGGDLTSYISPAASRPMAAYEYWLMYEEAGRGGI